MKIGIALIASSALLIGVSPAAAEGGADRIDVLVRTTRIVCAGVCPDFALSVAKDGSVVERIYQNRRTTVRKFVLSADEQSRFRLELSSLRAPGSNRFSIPCVDEADRAERPTGGVIYDIRWSALTGPSKPDCLDNKSTRLSIKFALLSIRVSPADGRRIDSRESRLRLDACLLASTRDGDERDCQ